MNKIPSISDAFERVVTATETAIIANNSVVFGQGIEKKVYFMHGHPKEIVSVLQAYSNSGAKKNEKYPLVALFRDVSEEPIVTLEKTSFKARLVICTLTSANLRAKDRELKNFKPILVPILEELLNQLSLSQEFDCPTLAEMKLKKTDRYFWGTSVADANIFNDCIDAIEIESISLKLTNLNCP